MSRPCRDTRAAWPRGKKRRHGRRTPYLRGYSDLVRTVTWDEALASAGDPIERGKLAQAIIDHEFRIHGE
ncbi:MAG TPA: hypothetical protein VJ901_16205, partial [Thermoanaerobaculia bacterium]|nr:hypothetical protein [Thermoanaerobaculia bacterium]